MKLIEVSHNKCVGCRLCAMVCSLVHEGECSAAKSRIKSYRDEEFGNDLVSVCMQCADAYCAESCPAGALNRDMKTGAVLVTAELCKTVPHRWALTLRAAKGLCPFGNPEYCNPVPRAQGVLIH